jgi:hypothetical protein
LFKIENIKGVVNNLVSKGIAYTVTLYPFFTSSYDHRYGNVIATFEPAFGKDIADKVYSEIREAFKSIDMYAKMLIATTQYLKHL